MGEAVKGIAKSKKFTFVLLITSLLMVARHFGIELSMKELGTIAGLSGIAVGGQAYSERDAKTVEAQAKADAEAKKAS